ncbi:uncharacterized protein LOC119669461 isoform X2 [Teleopsis dalmanni]|uniref:uncharacterized protein LOC119669461 isoform X2 n=1 Tax=Teleopsis dalmanni TaxID=139649 RepID=UPI0018CFE005|nr:uncharacterized protein LOC119669461 isoform X2 [Teleopsis dalmanni]
MAAENYHLKWDSHLSYLNSSVATLYKNEKFADVVLYSSSSHCASGSSSENGIPTVGISAHKFILSSCSQFFATMFETAPIAAPNGVLYVVLPPDLSHRAIQILVQYMYSGEATVSNDILSEVLRGGEILKIRGLCRTPNSHHRDPAGTNNYGTNGNRPLQLINNNQLPNTHASDIYISNKCARDNNVCGSRYSIEHAHQQQIRGLGASVMPKDSPVIVKSPKLSQMGLLAPLNKHHSGGISINKDVAIDPEDKCCYQANQHETLPPVVGNIAQCNEVGCSSCPIPTENEHIRNRQRVHSGESAVSSLRMSSDRLDRDFIEPPPDERCDSDENNMYYGRRLRRESDKDRVRDYYTSEHYEHQAVTGHKQFVESAAPRLTPPHAHNFLPIKQEPADWSTPGGSENSSDIINRQNTPIHSPKQPLDFKIPLGNTAVKLETVSTNSADEEEPPRPQNDYDTFTRLVCEICKKSFDDPKTWVRHLETHAQTQPIIHNPSATSTATSSNISTSNGDTLAKTFVPKKRRRVSQHDNNVDHVTLLCDLCSTSFETPAEWVRHMNNQHTEIELAIFNNKKDSEQKSNNSSTTSSSTASNSHQQQSSSHKKFSNRPYSTDQQDRVCDICQKKFSSNSSLLQHKRSHTHGTNSTHSSAHATRSLSPEQLNSASTQA